MRTPDKILIIRFSSLGDIILASPLIRILRSAYAHAQIDFLVKSAYAGLLSSNPHLSSVIELKSGDRDELRALRQQVRAARYDLILDIHNSLRSRYVRMFSGAQSVRVVRKRALSRFLLVRFKWNLYRDIVPVADRYIETVQSRGLQNDGMGLEVFLPEPSVASAAVIEGKFRASRFDRTLGMVPTARHFTKRWPQERFVEFGIQYGKMHRARMFLFGSREEAEYCGDIAQMINAGLGVAAAESVAGKLTLLETAAMFDRCDLVVTNDTGLMHLAAARRRKVVAIFGSTVREFGFYPYGTESAVVENRGLSCRPCSPIGLSACPLGHFQCMKGIAIADVLSTTTALLSPEFSMKGSGRNQP